MTFSPEMASERTDLTKRAGTALVDAEQGQKFCTYTERAPATYFAGR